MHRFRVNPEDVAGDTLVIRDQEARHLTKVLRLNLDEEVAAFDNSGTEYLARISEINPDRVVCTVLESYQTLKEPPIQVFLLQGLPKGDKMELIIQKTTELGITTISPIRTNRAVVQLEGKKAAERVARWQKIAAEAAKQCGRAKVPKVEEIKDISAALQSLPPDTLILAAYEAEQSQGLKEALINRPPGPIALVIGPEGGFTPQEITQLTQAGAISISLGPRILRTETAGLAALTMVLYDLGDLGLAPKDPKLGGTG